ncbi:hypothetical protein K435DRAFT_859356 [Dendrothele bispora CBS 962.96]|uniref:Uncharacterized protein n=1 Tax=Dendrothele bispora (strain CBS 962.96) TaxID=1314807 RepID=A0A4V4HFP1_DENBC|nr:hypothetical protein K435DRAFT_859356 [Dendrothele bispora CBS 962.96]
MLYWLNNTIVTPPKLELPVWKIFYRVLFEKYYSTWWPVAPEAGPSNAGGQDDDNDEEEEDDERPTPEPPAKRSRATGSKKSTPASGKKKTSKPKDSPEQTPCR